MNLERKDDVRNVLDLNCHLTIRVNLSEKGDGRLSGRRPMHKSLWQSRTAAGEEEVVHFRWHQDLE